MSNVVQQATISDYTGGKCTQSQSVALALINGTKMGRELNSWRWRAEGDPPVMTASALLCLPTSTSAAICLQYYYYPYQPAGDAFSGFIHLLQFCLPYEYVSYVYPRRVTDEGQTQHTSKNCKDCKTRGARRDTGGLKACQKIFLLWDMIE